MEMRGRGTYKALRRDPERQTRYGKTGNGVRLFKAGTAILSNSCGFGFNDELIELAFGLGLLQTTTLY